MVPGDARVLRQVLADARELGFLGPGPVDPHIVHARSFWQAWGPLGPVSPALKGPLGPRRALDLGSGAGLPGFPLALAWPGSHWTLVDANERRCRFLREAAGRLGLSGRVTVEMGRAEELAHQPHHRGAFDLVTARSFGPPAVTAECAAGFLAVGGRLLVSEPPDPSEDRWPPEGLLSLGMRRGPVTEGAGGRVRAIELTAPLPLRFPRRVGIPAKRPLF